MRSPSANRVSTAPRPPPPPPGPTAGSRRPHPLPPQRLLPSSQRPPFSLALSPLPHLRQGRCSLPLPAHPRPPLTPTGSLAIVAKALCRHRPAPLRARSDVTSAGDPFPTLLPSTRCRRVEATRRGACGSLLLRRGSRRLWGEGRWALRGGRAAYSAALGGFRRPPPGQPQGLGGSPGLQGVSVHRAFRGRSLHTTGRGGAGDPWTLWKGHRVEGSQCCLGPPLGIPSLLSVLFGTCCCYLGPLGLFGDKRCPSDADLLVFTRCTPATFWGRGCLGAVMAPSHLSVREMREDEKPVVLEMLKVRAGRGP